MDEKLIRDSLGSPVPQKLNDDGTYSAMANGDASNVDFSKKKMLRDRLGGVLPQQYYDVEKGRFVPGTVGGGSGVSEEDLLNLSEEVDRKIEQATTQLEDLLQDQNKTTGVGQIKIWTGTLAEYEALTTKDPSTIYHVRGT